MVLSAWLWSTHQVRSMISSCLGVVFTSLLMLWSAERADLGPISTDVTRLCKDNSHKTRQERSMPLDSTTVKNQKGLLAATKASSCKAHLRYKCPNFVPFIYSRSVQHILQVLLLPSVCFISFMYLLGGRRWRSEDNLLKSLLSFQHVSLWH